MTENNSKKIININKEKGNNIHDRNINTMLTNNSTTILDENIIKNMENLGFQKDYVQKCITNNEINYCSATYYLLLNNFPEIAN